MIPGPQIRARAFLPQIRSPPSAERIKGLQLLNQKTNTY